MIRHVKAIIVALAAMVCMMAGCNKNSVGPTSTSTDSPPIPTGATVVFSDGFGGDLSKYKASYMINVNDFYSPMRITTDAAHSGTHSVTSDSNRTALEYDLVPSIISGIVGVQFYIMAKSSGQTNFTVQIGKNAEDVEFK